MKFFVLLFITLLWSIVAVHANCVICDQYFVLSKATASCFEQNYQTFQNQIQSKNNAVISIKLGKCLGLKEDQRSTGALPSLPEANKPTIIINGRNRPVRFSYILDAQSIRCVKKTIDEMKPITDFGAIVFDNGGCKFVEQ